MPPPNGMEGSGHRDIIDVVTCPSSKRASLAPSCDPAIDESRISLQYRLRVQTESFHDPGPKPFDHDICTSQQPLRHLQTSSLFEIQADGTSASVENVISETEQRLGVGAVDPNNVRTHIGEHHPRELYRSDPGKLDDANACKRTRGRAAC